MQLLVEPGFAEPARIVGQLVAAAAGAERLGQGFGGKHAGLQCGVRTLDARGVEEAGVVANQRAAGENEFRQRLQATGREGARAVGDALAALEEGLHQRVQLVALELFERGEVRIAVGEADHVADRDQVALDVVNEAAAIGVGSHRPAAGVHDQALDVLLRLDLPQFLEADAVHLRIGAIAQLEFLLQLLAEMAAAALGEEGVLAEQLHARLVRLGGLAVAADAHVAGGDAFYRTILVVEHLGAGEAGVDFHAEGLGLLRQPAADIAQADDVVAVVEKAAREQGVGHLEAVRLGEDDEAILTDRRV